MEEFNFRYTELIETLQFQFEEFEFTKVFVKRCMVSNDQSFVAILIRCSFQEITNKNDCLYYFQIWSLPLKKCITSYQIQLTTQISQFKCCFSRCSYYFASFDCNGTVTVASLRYYQKYYTFELPKKHDWIEKIMIKDNEIFINVENQIYVHAIRDGQCIYAFQINFSIDNFIPISIDHFLFSSKGNPSLQIWHKKEKQIQQIQKQQELFTKQEYQELSLFNDSIIIGQLPMELHLFSVYHLRVFRRIPIDYQFNSIIVDQNIIILNTYRSKCPNIFYTECLPTVREREADRCPEVDYEFENLYFFSKVIIGWDYVNPAKKGFFVYRFKN